MKNASYTLALVLCTWIWVVPGQASAAVPPSMAGEYQIVESSQPKGGGGYRGKVTIEAPGAAHLVRWALGSGEAYNGPGILQNGVLGVGYGEGLTGLAVYEIRGGTLKAKWLLPAAPQQVGEYELSGPSSLNGFYKFTNGISGGITIKPKGKVYDLLWSLPTGSFAGIGVRVGDVLVAVSGKPRTNFGVAAYRAAGNDRLEGVWAIPGQTGLGTENLASTNSAPAPPAPAAVASSAGGGAAASFSAAGADVQFAGEKYHLEEGASAPGQPTSELREYLRPGETFDNYAKLFALRIQDAAGSAPTTFTRTLLQRTKKDYPQADTHEIESDNDSSTVEFLLKSGSDLEYNFWHYFRVPQGLASVQLVLRNKGLFDTEDKMKAERAANIETWVRDAKTLAPLVREAIGQTAKGGAAAAKPPEKKADMPDDELAAKIGADLQTAGGIAGNFLELLEAGKLNDAAAVVSDEGLTRAKTTRKDFLAKLQRAQGTDGRLVSFTPDKEKVDFGPEPGGGVYFVLWADGKCEKNATREMLRFLRFPDGKVKMVDYQRSPGKAAAGR